jgi:hypothetical protein
MRSAPAESVIVGQDVTALILNSLAIFEMKKIRGIPE